MKKFIFLTIILFYSCGVSNKEYYKRYPCEVIEISQVDRGGFIAPNGWTVKVKSPGGQTYYGTVFEPVLKGQTVYVDTWVEDGHLYYGTAFSPH